MTEPMYVLPVHQPDADNLVRGKMRQLARNFPCEPHYAGKQIAIQGTIGGEGRSRWAIVGVGELAGACYYPGFSRDPELSVGKTPIELARFGSAEGRYDPGLERRIWEWKDDGSGDWWGCCPRELDVDMMRRVQEVRRKRGR